MQHAETLAHVIQGIDQPDFPAIVARALCRFMDFDVAAIVWHGDGARPRLLFDSFDAVDGRDGLTAYVGHTHAMNPMVRAHARGAVRARDFASRDGAPGWRNPYVLASPEEELGFRTVGWPQGLEEIGLYFDAFGGLIELGLYRRRGRHLADSGDLCALDRLTLPIAAAFDTHCRLAERNAPPHRFTALSPREREVAAALVQGCNSEAIGLRLGISRHTVRDHRKSIFRKLGIVSLAQLFALC